MVSPDLGTPSEHVHQHKGGGVRIRWSLNPALCIEPNTNHKRIKMKTKIDQSVWIKENVEGNSNQFTLAVEKQKTCRFITRGLIFCTRLRLKSKYLDAIVFEIVKDTKSNSSTLRDTVSSKYVRIKGKRLYLKEGIEHASAFELELVNSV